MFVSPKSTVIFVAVIILCIVLAFIVGLHIGGRDPSVRELYGRAEALYQEGEFIRAQMRIDQFLLSRPRHRRARALRTKIEAALLQGTLDGDILPDDASRTQQDRIADGTPSADLADGTRTSAATALDARTPSDTASNRAANAAAAQAEAEQAAATRREQQEAAQARLRNINARDSRNAQTIEQLLEEGAQLLSRDETARARQKFEEVLAIELSDAPQSDAYDSIALARIANALRIEAQSDPQQYTNARTRISEAKALDANNWEAYYVEGLIAADRDDLNAANTAFSTAHRLQKDNADILYRLANTQYRQQRFDDATTNYRKVLSLAPRYTNAHHNLGLTLWQSNDIAGARQVFEEGITHYNADHRLHYRLGLAHLRLGRITDAERHLATAVRYNPQNATYHGKLGDAYYASYNIRSAKKEYERAAQLAPQNGVLQYNLAVALNLLQEYQNGKAAIDIALRTKPNSAPYHFTNGQILDGLGQKEQALRAFEKAVMLNANYPEAISEVGRMHVELGDSNTGITFLERAYRLLPNSPEVNNTIGNAYLSIQDYAQAINYFTRATTISPRNNLFRYNISLAYIELKQYSKALTQLVQIIDADATYWDAYLKIGVVHVARGEKEEARMVLSQLVQKNPSYHNIAEATRLLSNI